MNTKEKTAKALGYQVGDLVYTGAFPGILISDVNSATPTCEVFGFEQEMGSCYASDLRRLTKEEWLNSVFALGHKLPFRVWSQKSLGALRAVGISVEKAG